jgi:hypothetical protein
LDWQGLIPGISTRIDVINTLGKPDKIERVWRGNKWVFSYAYEVKSGIVGEFVYDRVFFRLNGVIDWIEVIEADRYGGFNEASTTVDLLGNELDKVYFNNNLCSSCEFQYDVLSGPDQLYVWSECGLALNTLANCVPNESDSLDCLVSEDINEINKLKPTELDLRYPPSSEMYIWPSLSTDNAVLMRFLFEPTTYEGFIDFYIDKVPFGLWDGYLYEIKIRDIYLP